LKHEFYIPYGSGKVSAQIPEENLAGVFQSKAIPGCDQLGQEIVSALAHPLDTPPIPDLVSTGEKVVILVDDHTRTTPADLILPAMLEELHKGGIREQDITIMITHGTHRFSTEEEVRKKVGNQIYGRIRIVQHDCTDEQNQVFVGVTSNGTPVWINRLVIETDRCLGIGHIGPSPYAGYSGGVKLIVPGVAALDTINTNHSLVVLGFREFGRTDLPCRVDIEEAASFVKLDLVVNVILSQAEEVVSVLAGTPRCVYQEGVTKAKTIYEVACSGNYDIAIAGAYPYDIDLYQAVRAVEYAEAAVRQGGSILLVSACPSGPGEGEFYQLMADRQKKSEDFLRDVVRRNGKVTFNVLGYALQRIKSEKVLYLLTDGIPKDQVEEMGFRQVSTLQEGVDELIKRYGRQAKVAVFPHGSTTIPLVKT
jgi:lactate racemase